MGDDIVRCKFCDKSIRKWITLKDGSKQSGVDKMVTHVENVHSTMLNGDGVAQDVLEAVNHSFIEKIPPPGMTLLGKDLISTNCGRLVHDVWPGALEDGKVLISLLEECGEWVIDGSDDVPGYTWVWSEDNSDIRETFFEGEPIPENLSVVEISVNEGR